MKRQFDKSEKELTERNLKKRREELTDFKEKLTAQKASNGAQILQNILDNLKKEFESKERILQDKLEEYNKVTRPYNQKISKEINEMKIKKIKQDIKETEEIIEIAEDQLKNGIEIRKISAVN